MLRALAAQVHENMTGEIDMVGDGTAVGFRWQVSAVAQLLKSLFDFNLVKNSVLLASMRHRSNLLGV
jgi:hypothetical protein